MFLESLDAAKCISIAVLPSVPAVFGCAQYMHSLGASPPISHLSPCHPGSPTSLSPPFPLNLSSHVNKLDLAWQRSLPCPARSHLRQLGQPGCWGTRPCLMGPVPCSALPFLQGLPRCPHRLPASLGLHFSRCFGPHRCNSGKDKVL